MSFDSLSSNNIMDNGVFTMPIDMVSQNPIILNGNFPSTASVSLGQSNSYDLNNQHQIMAGFPALSIMQGDPLNDFHSGLHLPNHAGIATTSNALVTRSTQLGDTSVGRSCSMSYVGVQDRFMAGMPISATSLATLLAARYDPHESLNDIDLLAPSAHPSEVLKTYVPNDYSDTPRSSLVNSANIVHDGILGDISSKWDFHKVLPPQLSGTVLQRTGLEPFQIMGNIDPNGWMSSENTSMSSDNTSGSSRYSNELSLSLSTCQPAVVCGTTIPEHCSEMSCSVLSHPLCERQLGLEQTSCNSKNLSLSFVSYKPAQLSQFLSGSRYLSEMQEILSQIATYALENLECLSYPTSGTAAGANFSFSSGRSVGRSDSVTGTGGLPDGNGHVVQGGEAEIKKKHLLDLLQMVDNRYNQCLDEVHTVISAFHAVTELDPHIHARFALQTISFMYKSLRERISNYIIAIGARLSEAAAGKREEERSFETSFIQKQWALQQLRRKDHQLWRPQRGLPERSVSVLRAWMFQNFLHPYPKDAEKHLLAVKSGLTRSQVSNWFINARVRLWKPMIEEMYSEMNRRKGRLRNGEETTDENLVGFDNQRFKMI